MTKRKSPHGNPLPEPGQLRRMVLVAWDDALHNEGYENEEDAWPYFPSWDIGFVLRDDEDGIVLGLSMVDSATDKRVRHVSSVPRGMIRGVWELPDPRGVQEAQPRGSNGAHPALPVYEIVPVGTGGFSSGNPS